MGNYSFTWKNPVFEEMIITQLRFNLYSYQDLCQGNERFGLLGNLVKICLKQGMKAKGCCSVRLKKGNKLHMCHITHM